MTRTELERMGPESGIPPLPRYTRKREFETIESWLVRSDATLLFFDGTPPPLGQTAACGRCADVLYTYPALGAGWFDLYRPQPRAEQPAGRSFAIR